MSELASKNTDSVTKAFDSGMISQRTALKELRQQSETTGMWSNITDEDIEKADADTARPDEGIGLPLLSQYEPTHTMDAGWEAEKHPRRPDGKFGSPGKTQKSGKKKQKRKRSFKEIRLERQEYAHVMSELNTHIPNEQRSNKIIKKAIGNYHYTVINLGFDNYRIIGKMKIK